MTIIFPLNTFVLQQTDFLLADLMKRVVILHNLQYRHFYRPEKLLNRALNKNFL